MYHQSNMSHGKHRSGHFHPKRRTWSGWLMLLRDIQARRERNAPARTEPMFDSTDELREWQKRTRYGMRRP